MTIHQVIELWDDLFSGSIHSCMVSPNRARKWISLDATIHEYSRDDPTLEDVIGFAANNVDPYQTILNYLTLRARIVKANPLPQTSGLENEFFERIS